MPFLVGSIHASLWASSLAALRHPFLPAGLAELFEAQQREKHSSGPIGADDLVFTGALRVGAMMACLEGETVDRIAALIDSSRALSGVLALVLASTPGGELSASEMDALTDLSYKIHLNLNQLEETWAQVSEELTRGRS